MLFEWDEEKNIINRASMLFPLRQRLKCLTIHITLRCMILNIVLRKTDTLR